MPGLLTSLFRRSAKRRAHSDLLSLDDRMLADIGVTRSEVRLQMTNLAMADLVGAHARA